MNVGLIMQETGGGFAEIYFTRNLKRARCLDPDIDEDLLLAIGREIEDRFRNVAQQPILISELIDRYSNVIQISSGQSCLASDPAKEMGQLIASLVESSRTTLVQHDEVEEKTERKVGRKWLRSKIGEAFWAEGLKGHIDENLPAAPYTNGRDGFTIDFSYVYRDEWKCFHAVSLVNIGPETRMFPLEVAKIKSGTAVIRRDKPQFTAIVEDYFNREDEKVKDIVAFMNADNIRVESVAEMPYIARQARIELGV